MADKQQKRPPGHLGPDGRKLWRDLISQFEINDAEGYALLQSACESLDRIQGANAEIDRLGLVIKNDQTGATRANPACQIEAAARGQFLQALKALRLDLQNVAGKPGRPLGR